MSETDDAIKYIISYCPHLGSFTNIGNVGNVFKFLDKVGSDINKAPETDVFPGRTKEHVAYAVAAIARNPFLSSPSVLASAYLVTRFELYFRVLSGVLNADGTWLAGSVPPHVAAVLGRLNKNRISSVATAYKLVTLNPSHKIASVFDQLDSDLSAYWSSKIANIGERIEWVRHPSAHGEMGDPSGEAVFYGLVTAIVFYNLP